MILPDASFLIYATVITRTYRFNSRVRRATRSRKRQILAAILHMVGARPSGSKQVLEQAVILDQSKLESLHLDYGTPQIPPGPALSAIRKAAAPVDSTVPAAPGRAQLTGKVIECQSPAQAGVRYGFRKNCIFYRLMQISTLCVAVWRCDRSKGAR